MTKQQSLVLRIRAARRAAERGVTLFEILVVLAIVALIGGGIGFAVNKQFQKARIKQAANDCTQLRQVAMQYIALSNPGGCPTAQQLKADGELDRSSKIEDPWGQPYTIACEGTEVIVRSAGPDGQENSDDDIVVGGGEAGE